jgi:hypothetical protein
MSEIINRIETKNIEELFQASFACGIHYQQERKEAVRQMLLLGVMLIRLIDCISKSSHSFIIEYFHCIQHFFFFHHHNRTTSVSYENDFSVSIDIHF